MHYKNGALVPIKMSIWDALKGAPSVKSKAKLKAVSDTQSVVVQTPAPVLYKSSASPAPVTIDGATFTPVIVNEPPPPELYTSLVPMDPANTAIEVNLISFLHQTANTDGRIVSVLPQDPRDARRIEEV